MGIDGFTQLLAKYAPNAIQRLPLNAFSNQNVAIDMNHLAYLLMSPSIKDVTYDHDFTVGKPDRSEIERKTICRILDHLTIFLNHQITPVCVFDGYPHQLKRTGNPKKQKSKEQEREKYRQAKQKLYSQETLFRLAPLVNDFVKYYRNHVKVKSEFMKNLREILSSFGFPVYGVEQFGKMSNDAEGLCAGLCLSGNDYCIAGYTTDSDFHVYGGNIQIKKIEFTDKSQNGIITRTYFAEVRRLDLILQQFSQSAGKPISFSAFRDLCILTGSDFNVNIPSKGPVRCWEFIKQFDSIDNLATCQDVSILNHREVQQMFSSFLVKLDIPKPEMNRQIFQEFASPMSESFQLQSYYRSFYSILFPSGKQINPTDSLLHLDPNNPERATIRVDETLPPNKEDIPIESLRSELSGLSF